MSDTLNHIRSMLDRADSLYYRGDAAELSDAEYDSIKNQLRLLDPNDVRLTRVGAQYSPDEIGEKVEHTIPMGSLDNTDNGILGYEKWYRSTCAKLGVADIDIMVSLKMDGSSIRARYEKGELVVVATRGNGEVGDNVTANAINFAGLPTTLPVPITCDVRGETMLYIADFKKICEDEHGVPFDDIEKTLISNPRNVGNGIVAREDGFNSKYIRFVPFNIVTEDKEFETEFDKIEFLKELSFNPIECHKCSNLDELYALYNKIVSDRDKLPFEIDGIVVVTASIEYQNRFITKDISSRLRPKHSRAIKLPHKSAQTKITGVTITVGHTGAIIPTAIVEEVRIGGTNVSNALLNNWDEISRLDVAIGDTVEVVLAGDLIPKIIRKIDSDVDTTRIIEPSFCPSCGSRTTRTLRGNNGAVTYCSQPKDCPSVRIGKIDHWIGSSKTGVGILAIGDATLKALVCSDLVADPADLYKLKVDDIKDLILDGNIKVGQSRAETIIENINGKRCLDLHIFLGSLGIELLGRKRAKLLIIDNGDNLSSIDKWLDINHLTKTIGDDSITMNSVINGISDNAWLIRKLLDNGVTIKGNQENSANGDSQDNVNDKPFAGLSFCFTGTREGVDEVESLGGIIKSGISRNLTFLVQKDALSTSKKTQLADSYGTKVISIDYLRKAIAGEVSLRDLVDPEAVVQQVRQPTERNTVKSEQKSAPKPAPKTDDTFDANTFVDDLFG